MSRYMSSHVLHTGTKVHVLYSSDAFCIGTCVVQHVVHVPMQNTSEEDGGVGEG